MKLSIFTRFIHAAVCWVNIMNGKWLNRITREKKTKYEMSKQKQIIRELCLHLQSNSYVTFFFFIVQSVNNGS